MKRKTLNGEMVEGTPVMGFSDPVRYKAKLDANLADRKVRRKTQERRCKNMSPLKYNTNEINSKYASLSLEDRLDNWNVKRVAKPGTAKSKRPRTGVQLFDGKETRR